jgi:hypothetical protein
LHQAGAQHSQSPVDADKGGDATTVLSRFPKLLVNTAHFTNKSQNCQIQIEARRANGGGLFNVQPTTSRLRQPK